MIYRTPCLHAPLEPVPGTRHQRLLSIGHEILGGAGAAERQDKLLSTIVAEQRRLRVRRRVLDELLHRRAVRRAGAHVVVGGRGERDVVD